MKAVLITGTTSGIGKEFAEKFASVGNNVILVARDEQKLNEQQLFLQDRYNVTVKYIAYDLTKEDAADLIANTLDEWNVYVDILINNAGFNECGFFVKTDITLTFLEYVTEYEKNSKNVKKLAFFSFQRERNVI